MALFLVKFKTICFIFKAPHILADLRPLASFLHYLCRQIVAGMILVADSGSTKTDWALVDGSEQPAFLQTAGMNPMLHSAEYLQEQMRLAVSRLPRVRQVNAVYFYGAGCWGEAQKAKIREALRPDLPKEAILQVEHDLLGAARAVCGRTAGIACILGTGSNSCLYNGENIVDTVPSLGYILGDEGSGADLGKHLIQAYFYRELPRGSAMELKAQVPGEKATVMERVYRQPNPNRYLASFAPFIHRHLEDPFLAQLVTERFREFLKRHVLKYDDAHALPVHFVGSIAYYFRPSMLEALKSSRLRPGQFLKRSIEALITFHQPS
jgi:N-acetylglucosamine kinase-like BadF-type ATPase